MKLLSHLCSFAKVVGGPDSTNMMCSAFSFGIVEQFSLLILSCLSSMVRRMVPLWDAILFTSMHYDQFRVKIQRCDSSKNQSKTNKEMDLWISAFDIPESRLLNPMANCVKEQFENITPLTMLFTHQPCF